MKTGVGVTGPLGWFSRLAGGGMIFGSDNTPVTTSEIDQTRASRFITRVRCAAIGRIWGRAPIRVTHEWSGVTSDTPDKYPVVGSLDGHRLYMLGGFAGAGSACSFLAGVPATIVIGSTLRVTTAPAAAIEPVPMTTPGRMTTRAPSQTSSSRRTGALLHP